MLISTARQEGLCVINSFEMEDESDAGHVITSTSSSTSRVVVLYMGTSLTTAFLTVSVTCYYCLPHSYCYLLLLSSSQLVLPVTTAFLTVSITCYHCLPHG